MWVELVLKIESPRNPTAPQIPWNFRDSHAVQSA